MLSVISIATACCIYVSVVCGSLAVILALLSSPDKSTRSGTATAAFFIGLVGIVSTIGITVYAFIFTVSQYGSIEAFMASYEQMYEQLLQGGGLSLSPEDMLGSGVL